MRPWTVFFLIASALIVGVFGGALAILIMHH